MNTFVIKLLTPAQAEARLADLSTLLIDAVEGGAGVNFVWPMTQAKADLWWSNVLSSAARSERFIFLAEENGRAVGTVQLILAPQENQVHRADVGKMLVHSSARRRGLGALLMQAAEDEARRQGRTLLTLDTQSGAAGERLYVRSGWLKVGQVPGFALHPDGSHYEAASFFYKQL